MVQGTRTKNCPPYNELVLMVIQALWTKGREEAEKERRTVESIRNWKCADPACQNTEKKKITICSSAGSLFCDQLKI